MCDISALKNLFERRTCVTVRYNFVA